MRPSAIARRLVMWEQLLTNHKNVTDMHDVSRDSLLHKDWEKKKQNHGTGPEPGADEAHHHEHEHYHHHHHHHHDSAQTSFFHRIFSDPGRDWFGLGFMVLLIAAGFFKLLPEHLSGGLLVCAAMIGIYPVWKNALFETIFKRQPTVELFASMALIVLLLAGQSLTAALCSLFMLAGSFMNLDFSWRR